MIEETKVDSKTPIFIEMRIIDALRKSCEFQGFLTNEDLEPIFSNILIWLIRHQPWALGHITSKVTQMRVKIQDMQMQVRCELQILRPIQAVMNFIYTLENDCKEAQTLRLQNDRLQFSQETRRFDLAAKAALAAVNVEHMAKKELGNPSQIILKSLPSQLAKYGFDGELQHISLSLRPDNTLGVHLAC